MKNNKVAELMTISLLGELDNILNVKSLEDKQFACFKPISQFAKEGSKGLYLLTCEDESKKVTEARMKKFLDHLSIEFEHADESTLAIAAEFLTKHVEQLPEEERARVYQNFTRNMETLIEHNMVSDEAEQRILDFVTSVITNISTEENIQ